MVNQNLFFLPFCQYLPTIFIFMISTHIMQSLYVCRPAQEKIAQEINKKRKKKIYGRGKQWQRLMTK